MNRLIIIATLSTKLLAIFLQAEYKCTKQENPPIRSFVCVNDDCQYLGINIVI